MQLIWHLLHLRLDNLAFLLLTMIGPHLSLPHCTSSLFLLKITLIKENLFQAY